MKKGVTCPGYCCAAFYLPRTKTQMQTKAKANPEDKELQQIADMIIPLTPKRARERNARFSGKESDAYKWKHRGHHFTCKNWDEKTKLCKIYEDRPDMCRDFPYGQECMFGCDNCGGLPTTERVAIREQTWLNQWKAYQAPKPPKELA